VWHVQPTNDEATVNGTVSDAAVEVAAIALTVSDIAATAGFFEAALDCEVAPDKCQRAGSGERSATLRLGAERIVLVERRPPGRPVPADSRSDDLWFQHVAIVVSDIRAACDRLNTLGVRHTSPAPQRLPAWNRNARGIEASYFRDPDGHPLELISFPFDKGEPRWHNTERLFLGIDHTAIAVTSTDAGLRFYRDGLGLNVQGRSENWGPEQERLSGVPGARVRITSLRGAAGPGVEFLHYLSPATGRPNPPDARPEDLWHIETRFQTADLTGVLRRLRFLLPEVDLDAAADQTVWLCDPDGHALSIATAGRSAA
jgi:catechol 2,3-dioxygenase-like lactoylglutathione lyase family enzyme